MKKAERFEEAAAKLREQILKGVFGERGQMPPMSVLEQELGVKHTTMVEVIRLLQGEGLVTGNGNRRLTATPPRKRVPLTDAPFTVYLRREGLEPVTEYLELPERKPMDKELATLFGVPEGTLYVARIRRDGTPMTKYRLTSKYYLSSLIDDETLKGMQGNDRYDAILDIKQKQGISAHFMTEDIIARLPTDQERELLNVVRTAPVLEVLRAGYDQEGGYVLWLNRIVHVGSLFVMHYEHRGEQLWKEAESNGR
jgi:DNA-binding GntR family transcriptional regulator